MNQQQLNIKIKTVLSDLTKEELEQFFQENFLNPLTMQLGNDETPAESIRQQYKQTQKIKNFLLTLRSK